MVIFLLATAIFTPNYNKMNGHIHQTIKLYLKLILSQNIIQAKIDIHSSFLKEIGEIILMALAIILALHS